MNEFTQSKVLCVGFCHVDRNNLEAMITYHFSAEVNEAHTAEEAKLLLSGSPYDLVLINKLLDGDRREGMELVQSLKENGILKDMPFMVISNRKDVQATAVSSGALSGFGKDKIFYKSVQEKLARFLTPKNQQV